LIIKDVADSGIRTLRLLTSVGAGVKKEGVKGVFEEYLERLKYTG
jgi:hypothetical protein